MNRTHTYYKFVGATVACAATSALLFLGAGTAQATQDVREGAPGITIGAFNPQPDPPGITDPGSRGPLIGDPGLKVAIGDPEDRVAIGDPGIKAGLGGPDTRPAR